MKNILLLGVPRSGKTTFSRMLLERYPKYQIINGDSFRQSIRHLISDSKLSSYEIGMLDEYQDILYNYFDKCTVYNKDLNYILDTTNIVPENAKRYENENSIIIYFGYPDLTVEEILENIRDNDTEIDWTYDRSDEELLEKIEKYLRASKKYQKKCADLGYKFVNTSYNRGSVLDELLDWIKYDE